VDYIYDSAGRRTQLTVSGLPAVTYQYDSANRLTQIAEGATVVGLSYDAASRRTGVTLPNGVVETYSYDDADELLGIAYDHSSTHIGDLSYTYDQVGRRIGQSGSLSILLIPGTVTAASYDAANRLTSWNGNTLSYDANGNLTALGPSTYSWNARDQLTATSDGGGIFAYDALGRRTSQSVAGATIPYLYDGANPVNVSGNLILNGFGPDERYTQIGSTTISYLTDALGSTVALTDANGSVVGSFGYGPYGSASQSGTATTPFQYSGRENDGTSNLYYYRARYYNPTIGRFISEDPARFVGGMNFYAYADGDPISERDPSGRCPWCIVAAVGATIGGIGNAYNNYAAYESGQITDFQYFEDIAVGAGTGALSGISGGGILGAALLGGLTGGANEGLQELISGDVNSCKIGLAAGARIATAAVFGPLGEALGNSVSRPVIGSLATSPGGYPDQGALAGFIASSLIMATPFPNWAFPNK
jgi:RHS repeat-associated protein